MILNFVVVESLNLKLIPLQFTQKQERKHIFNTGMHKVKRS